MTPLEIKMATLRRLFEPWNSARHGTAIWEPEASDPNAEFKRVFIANAIEVIVAGESALAGSSFNLPDFGDSSFSTIEKALATDPEEHAFMELAAACESIRRSLMQIAA